VTARFLGGGSGGKISGRRVHHGGTGRGHGGIPGKEAACALETGGGGNHGGGGMMKTCGRPQSIPIE
jgi:hypothetical protein